MRKITMILLIAALFSLFPACQQKQERETAAEKQKSGVVEYFLHYYKDLDIADVAVPAYIHVGSRMAVYVKEAYAVPEIPDKYTGELLLETDKDLTVSDLFDESPVKVTPEERNSSCCRWYSIKGVEDIEYLLLKREGSISLWKFSRFMTVPGGKLDPYYTDRDYSPCTYQEILSLIYGVNEEDDVQKIIVKPVDTDRTPNGIKIKERIPVREISDKEKVRDIYGMIKNLSFRERQGNSEPDPLRWPDSLEEVPLGEIRGAAYTREFVLELKNGSYADGLYYLATTGAFYGSGIDDLLSDQDMAVIQDLCIENYRE